MNDYYSWVILQFSVLESIEKGDEYDERDIQRFNEEDEYTLMFIRHGQYGTTFNETRALQYFNESMTWRKENNVYGKTNL